MIKSFSQFIVEDAPKEIVIVFEKFNPPTLHHEKFLNKIFEQAKGRPYRIYVSNSVDTKNNPLPLEEKVKWMRKMFPKHARNIVADSVSDIKDICYKLYEQKFTSVEICADDVRSIQYDTVLKANNGVFLEGEANKFFNFKKIRAVSITESNDLEDRMRLAAAANDFNTFAKGLPSSFTEIEELFNAVRNGLGLKESKNFRKHIQLETVSERREAYVAGQLFEVGDQVVIKESEEVGSITHCGPNYLLVSLSDGRKVRKWLNAVELVENKVIPNEKLDPAPMPTAKPIQVRTPTREGISISKIRTLNKAS